jgi:hypothetical protein
MDKEPRRLPVFHPDQIKAIPKHLGRVTGLRGQNGKMVATTSSGVDVILPDAGALDVAADDTSKL